MTNLRCEIEKELSMVAQRAGSEEVTNGRGDNTLINWNPSLEDKFVTKTRDQPEPGSFFPRSLWGGEMKDPGNEVVYSIAICNYRWNCIIVSTLEKLIYTGCH